MAGLTTTQGQEGWSSRVGFLLAAIGSSVGLGNLWRFPYQVGENGGAAFLLVYILCILLIGLPVLAAEVLIGRRGGGSAVSAIQRLARADGHSGLWQLLGWIGGITALLILTFYSVIAGWVVYYTVLMAGSVLENVMSQGVEGLLAPAFAGRSDEDVVGLLSNLHTRPHLMITFHTLFLALTVLIVSRGIRNGIEMAVKYLMPGFFGMLLILVLVSLVQGQAGASFSYLFKPDFGALMVGIKDGSLLLAALGQAFFSIGLGSAMLITYGLYLGKNVDIPSASVMIAGADTVVAIVAGLAIFPIVFQVGLEPSAGPGLMFISLPLVFQQMPFGGLFGLVFFIMAFFAAFTSAIALLEVPTAIIAKGHAATANNPQRRVIAAVGIGVVILIIGICNILSVVPADQPNFFNSWEPLPWIKIFADMQLLDFLDTVTSIVLMPLGGFLTAVFAGWVISTTASREELGFKSEVWYQRWLVLIRYVCPVAVGLVLLYGVVIAPLFL